MSVMASDIDRYPGRGRPRRRPFAAHAARAVRVRIANARTATQHVAWRLQGEPEVAAYLAQAVPAHYRYVISQYAVWVEALRRLDAALVDPSVPDEGVGDA